MNVNTFGKGLDLVDQLIKDKLTGVAMRYTGNASELTLHMF